MCLFELPERTLLIKYIDAHLRKQFAQDIEYRFVPFRLYRATKHTLLS